MKGLITVLAVTTLVTAGCACSPGANSSESPAPASTSAPATPSTSPLPSTPSTPLGGPSTPQPTPPGSPVATPTQMIPPASDIDFPEGSTYWRNSARIPVIAYRAADTLCWYFWTGLEATQRFTGTLTSANSVLQWDGVLGTSAYPGQIPSATPMMVQLRRLDDSGNWSVVRTDPPTGGMSAFMLNDAWAPSTAQDVAADFALTTGLSGYDAPVLTWCPAVSEFTE